MALEFVKPFRSILPEIPMPKGIPSMSTKLVWVGLALVIYFLMYNTTVVGVKPITLITGNINFLSAVTAANLGSLLTTGIGPIVLASIFLQLFTGAGFIKVDMSDPEQSKNYKTLQKLLAIGLAVVEALFFTIGKGFFALQDATVFGGDIMLTIIVTLQIAFGSIIVMYLDEIIQKRGIGSGISLFIAAGVSFMVLSLGLGLFGEAFNILMGGAGAGAEAIPMALGVLAPIASTAIVFLVVVYAEGLKVDIPLVFGRLRGLDTVHSIPLLYTSNIPVILTAALLMNVTIIAGLFPIVDTNQLGDAPSDFIEKVVWTAEKSPLSLFVYNSGAIVKDENGKVVQETKNFDDGLLYLLTPGSIIPNYNQDLGEHIGNLFTGSTPQLHIPNIIHLFIYILAYMLFSIMFGMFWVETSGMTSKDVSKQLFQYGLHIPGMRRDPRLIERTLDKYIPTITIMGAAFVGLLASVANIAGALGTGTGILLTVMILHRLYQQLDQMGAFRFVPFLGTLLGGK